MQLFGQTKFDFLGWRRVFYAVSAALIAVGVGSLILKGGPRYGIDFRGGALMYVKFASEPPIQKIRSALSARVRGGVSVTHLTDPASKNEVLIGTELQDEQALENARQTIIQTLKETFAPGETRLDFNNAGQEALVESLRNPLQKAGVALSDEQLQALVRAMLDFRNSPPRSGLISSFDELAAVPSVTPVIISVMKQELSLAPFAIRRVEIVGPKVGADLRWQAIKATLYALAGMLVYIAFRFEWIYGAAAVLAVFHDVVITVGLFSVFNKEIDLTVIAALLTLVGYSMNDTIVVFDRIRENLQILRRTPLPELVNLSVNQTLSRTVLTSGLTFLTVLSLFLFGGPVLNGFSFALVVGIIIGTYSSIFIASPILVWWKQLAEARARGGQRVSPAGKEADTRSELSRASERPRARKG